MYNVVQVYRYRIRRYLLRLHDIYYIYIYMITRTGWDPKLEKYDNLKLDFWLMHLMEYFDGLLNNEAQK